MTDVQEPEEPEVPETDVERVERERRLGQEREHYDVGESETDEDAELEEDE